MKISEFRKLIREEVRKVLKENVSAKEMADGIGLPYDNGKMAILFLKVAKELGMKQGPWNNQTPNKDFSFDYEMGDVEDDNELVNLKGENSEGNNPSTIYILNPKMQNDPRIQKLVQKCMDEYE
jgi:hypothetical protein